MTDVRNAIEGNQAKLDAIFPEEWLGERWFPKGDVQPWDLLAYKKFEIFNLCELIIYAIIIAILSAVNLSEGLVCDVALGLAVAAVCWLLLVMCLINKFVQPRKDDGNYDLAEDAV